MTLVRRATAVARSGRGGPSPVVAAVAVLATVLRLVLPIADTRVVERDPYHLHLVIGGTPAQRAEALAHHRHHGHERPRGSVGGLGRKGSRPPRTVGETREDRRAPRVVSVLPGTAPGAVVHSATGLVVATAAAPARPTGPRATGLVTRPASQRVMHEALPVPDPPPRVDLPI